MQSDKRFEMARYGFSLLLNPFFILGGRPPDSAGSEKLYHTRERFVKGKIKKIFFKKCLTLWFCGVIIISERRKERNKNMTRYHIYDREGNYVMTETNEAIAEQIAEELGGGYYEDNN